jgi:dihydrolipoamide dehydrogenase
MTDTYDIAIIGSGPGGYVAGIRAGQLHQKVLVIEKAATLGGVCLNWGCIPTKALIKNAEVVELIGGKAAAFGITLSEPRADWPAGVQRSRRVVQRMTKGVEGLFKKYNVELARGTARLRDAHTVAIAPAEGGAPRTVEARHVVLATGSRSKLLPGMVADGERIITSRHAVQLPRVPARLLIMGAGAVGMEFAYIFGAYGAEVTVIEMLPSVLPLEDPDVGQVVARAFARRGTRLLTGTRVESVTATEDGVRVVATTDGKEHSIDGDKVLVAVGRAPNSEDLGLEDAGVAVGGGFVTVDEAGRTSADGVFAIGDLAGPPMLAHKASRQGVDVVERITGAHPPRVDASCIPSCTYCQPQVGSVGLTEARAREEGYDVRVYKFPFQAIGRAVAIDDYVGWVKIVTDAKHGEVLGAAIVGAEATEIIHEIVLARSAELTIGHLIAMVHAHPTMSEAIHEAALGAIGQPLHL